MNLYNNKPIYLIDSKNPLIEENQLIIEATVASAAKKLAMSVSPEVVKVMDVSGPRKSCLPCSTIHSTLKRC